MEMAASASASTSTAADSNNGYSYDVFINHRGPDVKKTFASHLYRRLISHGLRVFLDYKELQEGEDLSCQILGAIRTASVHIAIFSPTYAESEWCMKELVLMLESKAPLIPVFHGVKPADVRRTRGEGVYARALHILEHKRTHDSQPRHNPSTIENWRYAFSRVAGISGLDLEAFNGDEGELVDKVVEVTLKKAKTLLNVARYPTGLDEKVEDFEKTVLLQQHNERVQVVGITGLGGVGKTTLAKELFNRKSSNYSKSHFLFDVREKAEISLLSLQKELLKGLTQSDVKIHSIDEGITKLSNHLSVLSSQVLLVLDDVDNADQVYALLPGTVKDILPTNSLILITSRDKNVLARSGVQEASIYKLNGLDVERSREPFCSHAFCQPHPFSGFENLAYNFISACDGLPLSLKVFGGLFHGNYDISYWEDELKRLDHILPDEIQKKLRISYDALHRDEQQMFLDIACFFIGENRDTAIRIWDGSGLLGSRGFRSLLNKCLVDVEIERKYWGVEIEIKIRMHDHLRDMGRAIAKDPGLPCRLWRGTNSIDDLLQQSYGKTAVRGVRMLRESYDDEHESDNMEEYAPPDDEDESASVSFYNMKKLELLDIVDIEPDRLECILRAVHSPNLIWLRWRQCFCKSLPPWIPMKKLRVLEVEGGEMETLWHQAPVKMRELRIATYSLSKIPESIGELKYLEWMELFSKSSIIIPEEFCHLRLLKHLRLNISGMMSLPDKFGNLTNLEHIDLSCRNLERLPNSFGNLVKLKNLLLNDCNNLTLSSENFENVSMLECIYLSFCNKIEVLPSQVVHQSSLEKLYLNLRNLKEWPSATGELSGLEELYLEAPLLETLSSSLGRDLKNLKHLRLQECLSLKHLPDFVPLSNQLTQWTAKDCSLQELHSKTVEGESEKRNIKTMVSFEELQEPECLKLKSIRCSAPLTQLRQLEVSGCAELEELAGVEHLRSLEVLKASDCAKLKRIRCSAHMTMLRQIEVRCRELEELAGFEHLRSLEVLDAYSCAKLKRIRFSTQLTQLRELEVSLCNELEELAGVEHLRSLEVLKAYKCVKLKRIRCSAPLTQRTQLRQLDVSYCYQLEELAGVEHLSSLEVLKASKCVKLNSIRCSAHMTMLRQIEVSLCRELEELAGVEHLRSLEVLNACHCVKLKRIRCSAQLTQLRQLDVSFCRELEELAGVEHLRSLEVLNASVCVKLKRIRCSAQLTQLRQLEVSFCYQLEELAGVEHLSSLKELWASGCVKLKTIGDLAQLTMLEKLEVFNCPVLEELAGLEHLNSFKTWS